jgi:hypothetical protein
MESVTAPVGLAVVGAAHWDLDDLGLQHSGLRELVAWWRAELVASG